MPFNSITFLVLFPAVLVGLALLPGRWRNGFLLVASYVFYGCWDYRFLLLLFATTVIAFWVGLEIAAARDAVVLALDIPQNISGDHTVFLLFPIPRSTGRRRCRTEGKRK